MQGQLVFTKEHLAERSKQLFFAAGVRFHECGQDRKEFFWRAQVFAEKLDKHEGVQEEVREQNRQFFHALELAFRATNIANKIEFDGGYNKMMGACIETMVKEGFPQEAVPFLFEGIMSKAEATVFATSIGTNHFDWIFDGLRDDQMERFFSLYPDDVKIWYFDVMKYYRSHRLLSNLHDEQNRRWMLDSLGRWLRSLLADCYSLEGKDVLLRFLSYENYKNGDERDKYFYMEPMVTIDLLGLEEATRAIAELYVSVPDVYVEPTLEEIEAALIGARQALRDTVEEMKTGEPVHPPKAIDLEKEKKLEIERRKAEWLIRGLVEKLMLEIQREPPSEHY